METLSAKDLARCIDHTLFAANASRKEIEKLCAEARDKFFYAVCVNSSRVELAYSLLEDSGVQVISLVGFPLGAADADVKRYETEIAVDQGAHEIEYVLNIGRLKDGDSQYVLREMRDIVEAADERPVKVILETHLLTREEKVLVCQIAVDSGAQFVVTSTDFQVPAVAIEDVKLLRETVGEKFGVKAVGGIAEAHRAIALMEAGATRLGTSFGPIIVQGLES
ncbi:deoxyribose-phosphate aldolase [Pedosphaera parvula]|uniref:Deoxyribose-phosphate aldolase n=1 Tax=Pedosphaera parvula (strain Ellin514) TaxID=320771 RepID=B9XQ89_PEDPL|nr:deoxyribose-phosphate aldolase [Pedosphaera parvula]EEF58007.1 deoxyribose-phosphate aldolase [Pedosphaera parvula Ellin514]